MRRTLSILITLVLGLGPMIAAIPASTLSGLASGLASGWSGKVDESQLPACCRRNGKHHCAMSSLPSQGTLAGSSDETAVSAKNDCPFAPQALDSTAPQIAALITAEPRSIAFQAELCAQRVDSPVARLSDRRSWPKRGPPAMPLL